MNVWSHNWVYWSHINYKQSTVSLIFLTNSLLSGNVWRYKIIDTFKYVTAFNSSKKYIIFFYLDKAILTKIQMIGIWDFNVRKTNETKKRTSGLNDRKSKKNQHKKLTLVWTRFCISYQENSSHNNLRCRQKGNIMLHYRQNSERSETSFLKVNNTSHPNRLISGAPPNVTSETNRSSSHLRSSEKYVLRFR